MTFLPIVERELRVAARQRVALWMRLGVAFAALVIGGWILLIPTFRSAQETGQALFVGLAIVAFFYSAFAGVLTTSDSLSEEKREGTLGLLFLTDLRGYDIVLGKLTAKSVHVFYGMLAMFPVMAIPLMAGGVAGAEVGRVTLVCLNNLFFSIALGMFVSAISRNERKAITAAVLTLLVLAGGFPLLAVVAWEWLELRELAPFLLLPSPGYTCVLAFSDVYANVGRDWNRFYQSVALLHASSWALLLASALIVPRTWQDKETSASVRRETWWRRLTRGSAETRADARRRMLAVNPFYWLAGRDRTKSLLVWTVLGIGGLVWLQGIIFNPRHWLDSSTYGVSAYAAHTILKIWVLFEAVRQLAEDRRSGALELLLATPLSSPQILHGQLRALGRHFGGPVAVILLVDFLFWLADFRDREWTIYMVAITTVFIADLAALTAFGMWQALRTRTLMRAAGITFALILVLPWVLFGFWLTFIGVMSNYVLSLPNDVWNFARVYSGPLIAIGIDLILGGLAWRWLSRHFRTVAAEGRIPRQVPEA